MTDIAIRVENLGKRYSIGGPKEPYKTIRETLLDVANAPVNLVKSAVGGHSGSAPEEMIWALKDVSFEVKQGEVIGIIGPNGAGKSTLLKILTRITEPTEGFAEIHGRVGSLLEVGTGFHPELTGRENIYLNGAILGMRKTEIQRNFDEIVDFSGVEKFIDTPVKRYSSGMQVRLAFAVAAHLEPEILLVDEVLAVGDAEFQKKCLGKMGDVAQEGRTVLFVSHNLQAVAKLCRRCVLLRFGEIHRDGSSAQVVTEYLGTGRNLRSEVVWGHDENAPGKKGTVRYGAARVVNSASEIISTVFVDEPFWIEVEYEILRPFPRSWLGISISTARGEIVFCTGDDNFELSEGIARLRGVYRSRCKIPGDLLNQDTYAISLLGHTPGIQSLVDEQAVLSIEVMQRQDTAGRGRQPGIIRPLIPWTTERVT